LSRLFMVSRSWRSQTQRTPAGETGSAHLHGAGDAFGDVR
jgi:hypothetical protein